MVGRVSPLVEGILGSSRTALEPFVIPSDPSSLSLEDAPHPADLALDLLLGLRVRWNLVSRGFQIRLMTTGRLCIRPRDGLPDEDTAAVITVPVTTRALIAYSDVRLPASCHRVRVVAT